MSASCMLRSVHKAKKIASLLTTISRLSGHFEIIQNTYNSSCVYIGLPSKFTQLDTGRQIGLIQEAKRTLRIMFLSGFWIGCYI